MRHPCKSKIPKETRILSRGTHNGVSMLQAQPRIQTVLLLASVDRAVRVT